jgi:IclR family acetate operon transcriptional repressor
LPDRVKEREGARLNQSVRKAIAILRVVGADAGGETASGVARATRLPWATAVRFIRTLEAEGFLTRLPETDRYVLGFDLLRLARAADQGARLGAIARPAIERVAAQVDETVSLVVVRTGERFEVVDQIDPPRFIGSTTWAAQVYPLHASAMGKLLLATYDEDDLTAFLAAPLESYTPATITDPGALREEMRRVREKGWSSNVDELEEGLSAIAAGVRGADGELVAMVAVSGPSFRFGDEARSAAVGPVREAAETVGRLVAGGEPAGRSRYAVVG